MDPMSWIALSGIASNLLGGFFGGGDGEERQSFANMPMISPINMLTDSRNATRGIGQGLTERLMNPVQLRSAFVQGGPGPVSIPGIPFQIGGGLGMDPALTDRSLLSLPGLNFSGGGISPFTPPTEQFAKANRRGQAGRGGAGTPGVRRRSVTDEREAF